MTPKFEKRHYKVMANIIKGQLRLLDTTREREAIHTFKAVLADYFAADNPRFDRDKFIAACRDHCIIGTYESVSEDSSIPR